MNVTNNTTVRELMLAHPDAVKVFLEHGVDVPLECDESIQDCNLELCDSMCHVDDIDALVRDLQKLLESTAES